MAILRNEFPVTDLTPALDLRHEISRLHTVINRAKPERGRQIENAVVAISRSGGFSAPEDAVVPSNLAVYAAFPELRDFRRAHDIAVNFAAAHGGGELQAAVRAQVDYLLSEQGWVYSLTKDLFGNGEQGVFYDPSGPTTLYQDAAGTTPVTAGGDPVGLMLDLHEGGPGPNKFEDGGFDQGVVPAEWTETSQTMLSVVNGQLQAIQVGGSTGDMAYAAFTTEVGKQYHFFGDFVAKGGGGRLYVGTRPGGTEYALQTVVGRLGVIFTAATTATYVSVGDPAATGATNVYDNFTLRELPGNHATQSVSAARPIYKTAGLLQQYDGVDDAMNVTLPSIPAATVITAKATGVEVQYPVDLSAGTYTITESHSGIIIREGQLSAREQQSVVNYLSTQQGVA